MRLKLLFLVSFLFQPLSTCAIQQKNPTLPLEKAFSVGWSYAIAPGSEENGRKQVSMTGPFLGIRLPSFKKVFWELEAHAVKNLVRNGYPYGFAILFSGNYRFAETPFFMGAAIGSGLFWLYEYGEDAHVWPIPIPPFLQGGADLELYKNVGLRLMLKISPLTTVYSIAPLTAFQTAMTVKF